MYLTARVLPRTAQHYLQQACRLLSMCCRRPSIDAAGPVLDPCNLAGLGINVLARAGGCLHRFYCILPTHRACVVVLVVPGRLSGCMVGATTGCLAFVTKSVRVDHGHVVLYSVP